MALLELIWIVLKTLVLSTMYATVVLLLVLLLSKTTKAQWIKKILARKRVFLLLTVVAFSVVLLTLSFSYENDTGLGDNVKIPVGYGQTIQNEDFEWTYFYPDPAKTVANQDELVIGQYRIEGQFLCAEVSHEFSNSPRFNFIVYDLKQRSMTTFQTEQAYSTYATQHSLPAKSTFYDFSQHYYEFLNNKPKWKRLLLP